MRKLETDLSTFRRFEFGHPPVGVKFVFSRPEGIEKLDKPAAFCEMIRIAQDRGAPFYFSKKEEDCFGRATRSSPHSTPGLSNPTCWC
jgi:uncharacterized protein (DUF169 family)